MNPLQPFYDQCNTGTNRQKYDNLPDFPRILDIELTSSCNFRCLMCPTGNLSLKRKPVFMDFQVLCDILRQCPEETAVRFIGWGEPTLHPDLVNAIRVAHRMSILVHVNTNGSKITKAYAKRLVSAGLASIKFSFQGTDRATYMEMRNTDFFEGMIEAIKAVRYERIGVFPFISASTTTTYETEEEIGEFRALLGPLVDQLTIGKTIFDYMDMSAVRLKPGDKALLQKLKALESVEKRHPNPCPEVFDKLSIHADGSVVVCCNDYNGTVDLGNAGEVAIKDMWRHPKIEEYRRKLAENDYSSSLCKDCYDYHNLTENREETDTVQRQAAI